MVKKVLGISSRSLVSGAVILERWKSKVRLPETLKFARRILCDTIVKTTVSRYNKMVSLAHPKREIPIPAHLFPIMCAYMYLDLDRN